MWTAGGVRGDAAHSFGSHSFGSLVLHSLCPHKTFFWGLSASPVPWLPHFLMMADSREIILRRLLVHQQTFYLNSARLENRGAPMYEDILRQASLFTPRDILERVEQLDDLFGHTLSTHEIGCLCSAAIIVGGANKFVYQLRTRAHSLHEYLTILSAF